MYTRGWHLVTLAKHNSPLDIRANHELPGVDRRVIQKSSQNGTGSELLYLRSHPVPFCENASTDFEPRAKVFGVDRRVIQNPSSFKTAQGAVFFTPEIRPRAVLKSRDLFVGVRRPDSRTPLVWRGWHTAIIICVYKQRHMPEFQKRVCTHCGKHLQAIGTSRKNGKPHRDWKTRRMHKKCWKLTNPPRARYTRRWWRPTPRF